MFVYDVLVLNRLLIVGLVALLLVALVSAVWNLCDQPPPRLILKYGFPPTGGPTGRTMTIEGVEFVELKPGYFRMGSHFLCEQGDSLGRICAVLHLPWGKHPRHDSKECPQRWTEIGRGFWIARTELTVQQYTRFRSPNLPERGRHAGPAKPVTQLADWERDQYFMWLGRDRGLLVRLPTEDEWEYTCRAGSKEEYCFGDDAASLAEFGWAAGNRWEAGGFSATEAVRMLRPNAWGIYDMHGNAREQCTPTGWTPVQTDRCGRPIGKPWPDVLRGGDVCCWPADCRCSSRYFPGYDDNMDTWTCRPVIDLD